MSNKLIINNRSVGSDYSPYIIAELSANHNGSLERALQTIEAAYHCGADAIKIQTYTAETMTIDCDREDFMIKGGLWDGYKLFDLYKMAHTPYEWHQAIFEHAKKIGITLFSTPFDESAVELLEDLNAPAYKIASFENTDLPLIERVARTGKPMIVSTGMASESEVSEIVKTARSAGCRELALLHCISSYPAPISEANVSQVSELAKKFNVVSGLSDHTLGTTTSIAAVAMGASIIEKHFILSREDKGPDSEFSIEPSEMSRLCKEAKYAKDSIGRPGFDAKQAEQSSKVFRRSIYFVRDLQAGSIICTKDIKRIRPGMGLQPKFYSDLIGKRLNVAVKRGMPTNWNYFD